MIDIAITELLVQVSGLSAERVSPSTENLLLNGPTFLPRIAYTLINHSPDYCDDGPTLENATYQVDVYADLPGHARRIIRRLRHSADAADPADRGLDSYQGTVDGTTIRRIAFEGERVDPGAMNPGENQTVARCTVDLRVWFLEGPEPAGT